MIMIVWLLNGFISWCWSNSSTGGKIQTDTTVLIPISIIKKANIKLIKAKRDSQIIVIQEDIINSKDVVIYDLAKINSELKERIVRIHNEKQAIIDERNKYKVRSRRASWAAVGSGSAFIVLFLLIL